jgi:hypothetical protein
MENPETQAKLGIRHKRDNQEWTIQRHMQHWALDTEGQSQMDNPETQATLGTRYRRGNQEWKVQRHSQYWALDTEGTFKNRQSRDICNIGHQTQKGQSRMDNPETQATFGTRHRRGTEEWIIQRHRQHWALDTEGAITYGQSRDTGNIGH